MKKYKKQKPPDVCTGKVNFDQTEGFSDTIHNTPEILLDGDDLYQNMNELTVSTIRRKSSKMENPINVDAVVGSGKKNKI